MKEFQWYFNRQCQPITQEEWIAGFSNDRHVDLTDLGPLGRVSTVFLGLNHNYGDGPPILFETMVFGGPMDEYMDRYYTEDEAAQGHAFVVQALMFYRAEKPPALIHKGRKPRK
jgi:hypothetical protein